MTSQELPYYMLCQLMDEPAASQRSLAERFDVSLGKVNYCLRALVDKGLVKANLLHGRYDAVPKGVQLSQMEKLIEAAALGVGLKTGSASPALALVRHQKLRETRYLFADYRTGGLLGLAVRSPVGVAARKLLRRVA